MQKHFCKNLSIWEAAVHPMDSYVWKDIANVRQIALLHMHQEDIGNWASTASPNGNSLFPQHGILSEVHGNILTNTTLCGFPLIAPKWLAVSSEP